MHLILQHTIFRYNTPTKENFFFQEYNMSDYVYNMCNKQLLIKAMTISWKIWTRVGNTATTGDGSRADIFRSWYPMLATEFEQGSEIWGLHCFIPTW